MMAKNDEVRQNLIPLSKQYMTLEAAQADIANIPEGSTTYVQPWQYSPGFEVINNGGVLEPTYGYAVTNSFSSFTRQICSMMVAFVQACAEDEKCRVI
jgi:hypothetical protein